MDCVTEYIYLGDSADANNRSNCLNEHGITAILNCAFDLDRPHYGRVQVICGLIDGEGNNANMFKYAVEMLRTLVVAGHKVLVHCHEGKSRSASVVAAYLAHYHGMSLEKAIDSLQTVRPIVNPCKPLITLADAYLFHVDNR